MPGVPGEPRDRGFLDQRPVSGRWRVGAGVLIFVLLFGAVVLSRVNPSEHSNLPPCPTVGVLGIYCPGCGSTRATHQMLNGNFAEAWRYNPMLVVVGLPVLALFMADLLSMVYRGRAFRVRPGGRVLMALAIVLIAYMVIRNIPVPWLEWSRPPR